MGEAADGRGLRSAEERHRQAAADAKALQRSVQIHLRVAARCVRDKPTIGRRVRAQAGYRLQQRLRCGTSRHIQTGTRGTYRKGTYMWDIQKGTRTVGHRNSKTVVIRHSLQALSEFIVARTDTDTWADVSNTNTHSLALGYKHFDRHRWFFMGPSAR